MHKPKLAVALLLLFIMIFVVGCGSQPAQQALPTVAVIPTQVAANTVPSEQTYSIVDEAVVASAPVAEVADTTTSDAVVVAQNTAPEVIAESQPQTVSDPVVVAPDVAAAQPDQQITDAAPQVEAPPQVPVENQLVLRFDAEASEQDRAEFIESVGGTVKEEIGALDTVIIEISEENQALLEANRDTNETLLAQTEPDYYVTAQANIAPLDTYYGSQWGLQAIHMPSRWQQLPDDAPTLTIAVIDSGVCLNHPDLAGRLLAGWDYVDDDNLPEDEHGHGCGMAGVIAANINDTGVAGVDPNVQVLPLRVLDATSRGTYSDVAAAVIRATDDGADVINLSLAGYYPSTTMEDAVNYATQRGVIVIAAAGNAGAETSYYPAAYPNVVSVGSVDSDLSVSSFSNYGDTISIYAPGRDIWTTGMNDSYRTLSGTSPAAAHVSAVATLMLASDTTPAITDNMMLFEALEQAEPTPVPQVEEEELVEAQSINGVIGIDDRVTQSVAVTDGTPNMPYGGIVHILYNGAGACTGTVLTPTRVLTLAECVVDRNGTDLFAGQTISVIPGRSGTTEPYGKIIVDTANTDVAPGWNPPTNTAIANNYAILTLESPLPGAISNPWELEAATNNQLDNNLSYELSGYPSPGGCVNNNQCGDIQNKATGQLFTAYNTGDAVAGQLRYQLDAEDRGQRGSPIFRFDAGTSEYRIVGMHVGVGTTSDPIDPQFNEGIRFTNTVLTQVRTTWSIDDQTEATPNVFTVGDNSEVNLVDAIEDANNAAPNPATVLLQPGAIYNLSSSAQINILPNITNNVTIVGRGATLRQNTNASRRLVTVANGGTLNLVGALTIQEFSNGSNGGAILVQGGGTLTITDAVFQNNQVSSGGSGGAIFTFPTSTTEITNSRFVNNVAAANGGALYNQGTMVIRNEDDPDGLLSEIGFASNQAIAGTEQERQGGGAIYNASSGVLTISSTTFAENVAGGSGTFGNGGAIANVDTAQLNVFSNTTFRQNASSQNGGAFVQYSSQAATFNTTIFSLNVAGPRSPQDTVPSGAGSVMLSEGPVVMTDVEAIDNIALRRDQAAVDGTPTEYIGGAFDIGGNFTIQSSEADEVQNFIQSNKILFDQNLDLDLAGSLEEQLSDADRISEGAAFYVDGNGFNVNISDTCITSNISLTYQGIFRQGSATVNANDNWWGSVSGPSDNTNNAGDGSNVPINSFLTEQPGDCEASTLPPTNDDFGNAFEIALLEDSQGFNNSRADVGNFGEEGEDVAEAKGDPQLVECGNLAKSIWYSYTPTKDYNISVTVNPYDTDQAIPRFGIVTGIPGDFTVLDCASGGTEQQATISSFSVTANTTYHIIVGTTTAQGGDSFIDIDVEDVVLSQPLPGTVFENRRPDFVWNTVGYADRYILEIRSGNTTIVSDQVLPTDCTATQCTIQPSISLANANYTAQITAIDDTITNSTAEQRSNQVGFAVNSSTSIIPQPVVLINPVDTATSDDGLPVFAWSTREYATRYQLNVTGTQNLTVNLAPGECEETTCSYVPTQALPNGNYTWSVTAFDETLDPSDEFYQLTSTQRTFTVDTGSSGGPQAPDLISPGDLATITNTRRPDLVWTAESYATRYTITLTFEGTTTVTYDVPAYWCSSICSINPGRFPNGSYTWFVTAFDETLNTNDPLYSLDSATRTLTVDSFIDLNLITNGDFSNGLTGYTLFTPTNQTTAVNGNGVLEARRTGASQFVTAFATDVSVSLNQGQRVEVFAQFGNTSNEPKRVGLGVADKNIPLQDPRLCFFVIPPNTPLDNYVAEMTIPANWTQAIAGVVLQDFNEPNLLVDNLGIGRNDFLPQNVQNCIAPSLRENAELIVNGDFTNGSEFFALPTTLTSSVVDGRLNTTRNNTSVNEAIEQFVVSTTPQANTPFELTIGLANTSAVQKDVLVRLADTTNANNIIACVFTLPAGIGQRTYTMRGETNNNWNEFRLQIFPQDNNRPNLQVDNIVLRYKPFQTTTNTTCDGVNLVPNGDLSQGGANWVGFGQFSAVLTDGVASLRRTNAAAPAGATNTLSAGINSNDRMEVAVQLGNTSSERRQVRIQIRDKNIPTIQLTCAFSLDPNTPLRTYYLRSVVASTLANPEFVIYLDDFNQPDALVDNIRVHKLSPTFPIDSSNPCIPPTKPSDVNLAINSGFENGTGLYNVNPQNVVNAQGGILQFRNSTIGLYPITQIVPFEFDAGSPIELTAQLGNQASFQRNVIIAIANGSDLSEPRFCAFPIAANAPLANYTLRVNTPSNWSSLAIAVTLPSGDANAVFATADNLNVFYRPNQNYATQECIDPNVASSLSVEAPIIEASTNQTLIANMADASEWQVEGAWSLTEDAANAMNNLGWQILATSDGGTLTWLPTANLTGFSAPQLTFDSRQISGGNVAAVQVKAGEADWQTVQEVAATDDWEKITVDLSDYIGQSINIRFAWSGSDSDIWQINTVQISDVPSIIESGVIEISEPAPVEETTEATPIPTEITVTEEPVVPAETEDSTEVTVTEEPAVVVPTEASTTEEPTEATATEEPTEATVIEPVTETTETEVPTEAPVEPSPEPQPAEVASDEPEAPVIEMPAEDNSEVVIESSE